MANGVDPDPMMHSIESAFSSLAEPILGKKMVFHIRPNYCTMRLHFSKLLGKLVKYVYLLRVHLKKKKKRSNY